MGVLAGWVLTHSDTAPALPRLQQNSPDISNPTQQQGLVQDTPSACTAALHSQGEEEEEPFPAQLWCSGLDCTESLTAGPFTFRCTNTNLKQEKIPHGSLLGMTKQTIKKWLLWCCSDLSHKYKIKDLLKGRLQNIY